MTEFNWYGNTSGRGTSEGLPQDIKELWNWGAFLLCPFWALAHNRYLLAFLSVVPGASIVAGFKGNAWAWQSVEWKSIDHFQTEQKTWAWVALALTILTIVCKVLLVLLKYYSLNHK
jgi:hypothetical protein